MDCGDCSCNYVVQMIEFFITLVLGVIISIYWVTRFKKYLREENLDFAPTPLFVLFLIFILSYWVASFIVFILGFLI